MSCFSVWLKSTNKQIRLFPYLAFSPSYMARAKTLAIDLALRNHVNGRPCTVEQHHMTDVGKLIFDSENGATL